MVVVVVVWYEISVRIINQYNACKSNHGRRVTFAYIEFRPMINNTNNKIRIPFPNKNQTIFFENIRFRLLWVTF